MTNGDATHVTDAPARRITHYATPVEADELEFIQAIENFKKATDHRFLSWSEVLVVVRRLGYAKTDP